MFICNRIWMQSILSPIHTYIWQYMGFLGQFLHVLVNFLWFWYVFRQYKWWKKVVFYIENEETTYQSHLYWKESMTSSPRSVTCNSCILKLIYSNFGGIIEYSIQLKNCISSWKIHWNVYLILFFIFLYKSKVLRHFNNKISH